MTLRELTRISPLGCVGMFLMGGVFSAQFGMAAVYGTERGLTVAEISIFVTAIYLGALLLQYPIGWLSDRMDRRVLILAVSVLGGLGGLQAFFMTMCLSFLLGAASLLGACRTRFMRC
jgi:MFS family permease